MAQETGLDFSDQILSLENKYRQVCYYFSQNSYSKKC